MKEIVHTDKQIIETLSCVFDDFSDPICITSADSNSKVLYANMALAKLARVKTPDDLNEKYYEEIHSPLCENEKTVSDWREQDKQIAANPLKELMMLEVHPESADNPYTVRKTAFYSKEKKFIGVLLHIKYLELFRPNDFIKGKLPGSLLLHKPDDFFTEKECEIIFLKLQGMTSRAIARTLYRFPRTIENIIQELYDKTGVNNAVDFAEFCEKRNLHRYLPHCFISPKRLSFSGSFQVGDDAC